MHGNIGRQQQPEHCWTEMKNSKAAQSISFNFFSHRSPEVKMLNILRDGSRLGYDTLFILPLNHHRTFVITVDSVTPQRTDVPMLCDLNVLGVRKMKQCSEFCLSPILLPLRASLLSADTQWVYEKCSISLAIREMLIKTTTWTSYLTLVSSFQPDKGWQLARMLGKRNTHTLLIGMQIGTAIWKSEWRPLKNLRPELSYDPGIWALGIHLKDCKAERYKDPFTSMVVPTWFIVDTI